MKQSLSRAMLAAAGAIALAAACPRAATAALPGNDTITLGSVLSLTGERRQEGRSAIDGYQLAINLINDRGGVRINGRNYKLGLHYYDDESKPALRGRLLERLILRDGVRYFLGAYGIDATQAATVTEQYRVPTVAAGPLPRPQAPGKYRYLFTVASAPDQYLSGVVDLAAELTMRQGRQPAEVRIAMAFEHDPFSLEVREGVLAAARKHRMRIVVDDVLAHGTSDMSSTLKKVGALRPDLLLVSAHAAGAIATGRQLDDIGVGAEPPLVAVTHCEAANVVGKHPGKAEGLLCPVQWASTLENNDALFGSAAGYDRLFRQSYPAHDAASWQAAPASAAVQVWKTAFERARNFDTDRLRDAIADTDIETFFGRIRFDRNGNNVAKPMIVWQIQSGRYEVVAPVKWASRRLQRHAAR